MINEFDCQKIYEEYKSVTWLDIGSTIFLVGLGVLKLFELTICACNWVKKKVDSQ